MTDSHHFVRYEGREGQTRQPLSFMHEYTNVFIPVLHHGAIVCGVHKCVHAVPVDVVQGAHSWDERLEWICPILHEG